MPKMGISVDETTHRLLRKHGGQRRVGALIGKLVRQFDQDESIGLQTIYEQLDRLIQTIDKQREESIRD